MSADELTQEIKDLKVAIKGLEEDRKAAKQEGNEKRYDQLSEEILLEKKRLYRYEEQVHASEQKQEVASNASDLFSVNCIFACLVPGVDPLPLKSIAQLPENTLVSLFGSWQHNDRDALFATHLGRVVTRSVKELCTWFSNNLAILNEAERVKLLRVVGPSGTGKSQAALILAAGLSAHPGINCVYVRQLTKGDTYVALRSMMGRIKREGTSTVFICDQIVDDTLAKELAEHAGGPCYIVMIGSANLPALFELSKGAQSRWDSFRFGHAPYSSCRLMAGLLDPRQYASLPTTIQHRFPQTLKEMREFPPPKTFYDAFIWSAGHAYTLVRFTRGHSADAVLTEEAALIANWIAGSHPTFFIAAYEMFQQEADYALPQLSGCSDSDIDVRYFGFEARTANSALALQALQRALFSTPISTDMLRHIVLTYPPPSDAANPSVHGFAVERFGLSNDNLRSYVRSMKYLMPTLDVPEHNPTTSLDSVVTRVTYTNLSDLVPYVSVKPVHGIPTRWKEPDIDGILLYWLGNHFLVIIGVQITVLPTSEHKHSLKWDPNELKQALINRGFLVAGTYLLFVSKQTASTTITYADEVHVDDVLEYPVQLLARQTFQEAKQAEWDNHGFRQLRVIPPPVVQRATCGCKSVNKDGKRCTSEKCSCHKQQKECSNACLCGGPAHMCSRGAVMDTD